MWHRARAAVLAGSALAKVDRLIAEEALIAIEARAREGRHGAGADAMSARTGRARIVGQFAARARVAARTRAREEGQRERGGALAAVEARPGVAADVEIALGARERIGAHAPVAERRRGEQARAVVATRRALTKVDLDGARGPGEAEQALARVAVELRDARGRVVARRRHAEVDRELAVDARVAGRADARVGV